MVTDTFFPVSVERLGLIVQDTPMQDEGQQVADELVEVEELVEDELDAEQETETDAEPAAEVGVDEVDDEAVADDFQDCVVGHQVESEPGPGPGPSLGPFCSDILSWLCCCKLAIRLVASRSSRKRTASLRQGPLIVVSANYRELLSMPISRSLVSLKKKHDYSSYVFTQIFHRYASILFASIFYIEEISRNKSLFILYADPHCYRIAQSSI